MSTEEKPKCWLSIPYVKNVSEATARLLKPFGIGVAHKPALTIRQRLMKPKDPLPMTEQSAVVYSIPCQDCDARYVGETGKRLGTRLHERQLAINREDKLSMVYSHMQQRKHVFAFDKTRVIGRANNKMARLLLESWSSTGTLKRAIELNPAYQAIRAVLTPAQNGALRPGSGDTGSQQPAVTSRIGGERESHDRHGMGSHEDNCETANEGEADDDSREVANAGNAGGSEEQAAAAPITAEKTAPINSQRTDERTGVKHGYNTRLAARRTNSRPAEE